MKIPNNFSQDTINIRRKIHQNPELGGCEFKTAALIEETLKKLKIPSKRIGKTGVVGMLKGSLKKGSLGTIAFRADTDALPITEISNKPYKSKNSGTMHACGHDAHVAIVLGAAALCAQNAQNLNGNVKFIFQPNEENSQGAKSLIDGGALQNPKVNAIIGVHVCPWVKSGQIGLKYGAMMAGVDQFKVEISGLTGHGAYPEKTIDPVAASATFVCDLQTIVSRNISPLEHAVLSVGKIYGGQSYNIIASKVSLEGTVRTLNQKTRVKIKKLFMDKIKALELSRGVKCKVSYEATGNPLINTSRIVDLCCTAAEETYGKKNIVMLTEPSMGGEDFAEYIKKIPGSFVYVGTSKNPATSYYWHHESFDVDEPALPKASEFLYNTAKNFFSR